MRISDWSSDVCSSDLNLLEIDVAAVVRQPDLGFEAGTDDLLAAQRFDAFGDERARVANPCPFLLQPVIPAKAGIQGGVGRRTPWIPAFEGLTNIGKRGPLEQMYNAAAGIARDPPFLGGENQHRRREQDRAGESREGDEE